MAKTYRIHLEGVWIKIMSSVASFIHMKLENNLNLSARKLT